MFALPVFTSVSFTLLTSGAVLSIVMSNTPAVVFVSVLFVPSAVNLPLAEGVNTAFHDLIAVSFPVIAFDAIE